MKFSVLKLLFAALLLLQAGCLYSKVVGPLDTDVNHTVLGPKTGRSSSYSVLFLVAWGDGGVKAAAKNGELTSVNHLDVEYYTVLFGAFTRVTTIAYGE